MPSWPISLYNRAAERLDRRFGWDKLPLPLAMLDADRAAQHACARRTSTTPAAGRSTARTSPAHPRYLTARTLDGTFNDLDDPLMGSLGSRFGRNVPLESTVREPEDACSSRTRARSAASC